MKTKAQRVGRKAKAGAFPVWTDEQRHEAYMAGGNQTRINFREVDGLRDEFTVGSEEYWDKARRLAKREGPQRCVYFARMGNTDAVKIGCSSNGIERVLSLQVGSPVDLHIVGFINFIEFEMARVAEQIAHALCVEMGIGRLRGEWFRMTAPGIEALIKAVATQGEQFVWAATWEDAK